MAKGKRRFYAVAAGRATGIFDRWDGGAREQVDGFRASKYQSFATLFLALEWWAIEAEGREVTYHFPAEGEDRTEIETVEFNLLPVETDEPFVVYLIIDPRNGKPFYVGQTRDLDRRQTSHLAIKSLKGSADKKRRLLEIQAAGMEPDFRIVQGYADEAASLAGESAWIKACVSNGHDVFNERREHKDIRSLYRP